MTQPIVKVENLCHKVGQRYLLNHINWEVQPGENWILFGLNGSGKTTLLSIIAGFKAFTEGKLQVFGQTYTNDNILDIRRQIGWISSSFFDKYFANETVLNVVLSGLTGSFGIQYDTHNQDIRLAKKLLEELRIANKMNSLYAQLSKGERQDVLIARALITSPKLLLLDEPDNGLDVYAREHIRNTIQSLAKNPDITVICVTHYPENISAQFDHCMLLRYGHVYAQGKTEDVMTSENISALFGETVQVAEDGKGAYKMRLHVPSCLHDLCYGQGGVGRGLY